MSSDADATQQLSELRPDARPKSAIAWSGVVLAGGRSERMGSDKSLLNIAGEPLYLRQLRLLSDAGASELLLSAAPGTRYTGLKSTRLIHDGHAGAGPLGGLVTALQATSSPFVFLLAVDLPGITLSLVRRILAASSARCGCVPVVDGRFEPLAAAYPVLLLGRAEANLASGRRSVQDLVRDAISMGLMTGLPIPASETSGFTNCNTREEWARFLDSQKP